MIFKSSLIDSLWFNIYIVWVTLVDEGKVQACNPDDCDELIMNKIEVVYEKEMEKTEIGMKKKREN